MEPWKNAINPVLRAQMYTVSLEALRICGILLQPFIPTKSTELLNALGITTEERTWAFAEIAKGRIGEVRQDMILFVNPRRSKHK
jgi:methionyl-tRNA synthetase